MTDWTEMSPLMRQAVTALLALPGESGDGLFLDPEDMHVQAKGAVRADRIAEACPPWVQRGPDPRDHLYICDAAVTCDSLESFRGDPADLLVPVLRGVLGQFVSIGAVRAIIWEGEEPPNYRKLILRFKVRGQRKEDPATA